MSNRFTKATLLAGTFMAGAMVATPVVAQDTAADAVSADEYEGLIVVTGSRIARRNVESAAPVAVVGAEEFELSGTVNVENVINTLPQVVPGSTSFSNNPGTGTATLNLRGLESARTLVLVNGRRWVSYDTNQIVDLNTIPSFLLDSVDVVTGGVSAVYGSDAIAGVVNFRLKEVEGVELGGQYNVTERGDGQSYNLHGAIGAQFDDGRGSATVYAEYFNRDSIFQGDRDFSNFALGDDSSKRPLKQFGSSTLPNGVLRYLGGKSGNNLGPDLNTTGDKYDPNAFRERTLGASGTEFGPDNSGFGSGVVFDNVAGDFRRRAGDTYNYAPANYLQLPQERYLLGGFADYEFADGHEFYTEVTYVNNRVAAELAPTPVTGTFTLNLDTVAPFLAASDIAQLRSIDAAETAANALFNTEMADQDDETPGVQFTAAVDDPGVVDFFVQRRIVETGSRNSLDERSAFRVLGGVRGAITDWLNYDAYYSFGRTRNSQIQKGNISKSAFAAGLDGTGTAINIFGLGTLSKASVDQISIAAQNSDISTLEVASAALSGYIGDLGLGGGDIGFALGVEYRGVASQFIPDTALSSGDVIGFNAGLPTAGSYNVKELFAEVNIPILGPESGVERLEVIGAGRYSDYSLGAVGGVFTYAGGIEFAPVRDIMLRAQYQRAIRAPNVGELFGGRAIGFPNATDPCNNATDAGTIATCVGSLPAGANASVIGSGSIQPNSQVPATFGGNPDLQEETSTSFTVGAVMEPRFIPGLTVTVDYFNIEIEDAIRTFGGGLNSALNLCFNVVKDINAPICAPFKGNRSSGGAYTTANNPLVLAANTAKLEASGVDLDVNYATSIPFSLLTDSGEQDLNISFLGTWTSKNDLTPVQGQPTIITCAGEFGKTCGEPTPKFKFSSRFTFIDGPLTTSISWNHLSSVKDDNDDVNFATYNGTEVIDSYDTFDLTFGFEASEQLTVNIGVTNLLDKLPAAPIFDASGNVTNTVSGSLIGDNQGQANTFPSTYDVLGRRMFVSAAFKF